MNSGWIKLHRCLLNDPVWKQATHPQRSVLIVALLLANHAENKWTWNGKKYSCAPGQFITSIRGLADKAGVTVKVARCAMERLRKLDFWALDTAQEGTKITIRNWDKYQYSDNAEGHSEGQARGTGGAHNKNDKKERSNSYFKKSAPEGAERTPKQSFSQEAFDRFWEAFADKRGKADAIKAWKSIKGMSPELVEQIVAGAKAYAGQRPSLIAKGQTPKMAQGWLSGRRWEDETESPAPTTCKACRYYPGECQGKEEICSAYKGAI